MKNKTLPIVAIIIMVFLGACNTDDDLLVNNPEQTRTLTLTASMPDDGPTTRIALEKNDDNTIALTWEATDKLQLLFVQNDFKEKTEAAVKNITEDGKKAQFDIVLPSAITGGDFTLYGVYGGGGLDDANPANVILPANPGNASSLEDVQTRKDLVLYFESANIDVANPKVTVLFQHLGSLFNITLKNTAATNLENIKEVRLVGVGGDGKWAYNSNEGAQTYNLLTGEFENQGTAGNYISFSAASTTVLADEEINFWGWYPPLPEKHWPELKLELWNETTATATSINSKIARNNATATGKAYYFYAIWNGSKISFTDSSFTPEFYIEEGGLDAALGDDKDNIAAMALRGTINDDDFDVMKSMSSLRRLDLSGVTITGNKIPDYAFGAAPPPEVGSKNIAPKGKASIQKNNTDLIHTANTTIESVVLPDDITSIGNYAFAGCINLKGNITIPNNVKSIGDGAFDGCIKLDGELILPESLETIGARAFRYCIFNSELNLPANLVSIGEEAFNYCEHLHGDLNIPTGVTWIGKSAFANCSQMWGSLTLPPGITSIEDHTFNSCGFRGSLIIPEGVTSIGVGAFNGVRNFNGIISLPQSLETIATHAFWGSGDFEGDLVIPNNITAIEDNTFTYTTFSGTLTLSENLKTIGKEAFQLSDRFTGTLVIPEGVTLIDDYAFQGCANSQSMPFGVKPQFIIDEPGGFNSLVLPESLITIGRYAFHDCSGFKGNLYLSDNITSIGWSAFENCAGFTGNLKLPAQLEVIGMSAFERCSGFDGTLTLPIALKKIEANAFAGCENLTGPLSFPATLTTVEYDAFAGCRSFTGELIIPATLNEVPSAFADCEGFTKLTLHEGVTAIEGGAFTNCSGFEGNLNLPSNLTYIGSEAFSGCTGFTGILNLPSGLNDLKENAFQGCRGFTGTLSIPQAITTIESGTFADCTGFETLTLHDQITTIKREAFSACTGFTGTLKLPAELITIEGSIYSEGAFANCTGFTGLSIASKLKTIGTKAFQNCNAITGLVVFPIKLESIGEEGFNGCTTVVAFRFPHLYPEDPLKYTTNMIPYEAEIEVPFGAFDRYKSNDKWNHHTISTYITGEAGLP